MNVAPDGFEQGWLVEVPRGGVWRFAWTPNPVAGPDGRPRWAAAAFRMGPWTAPAAPGARWRRFDDVPAVHQPTAVRQARMARVCYFARRWVARDRAWRWCCAKTGAQFFSLRPRRADQGAGSRR